MTFNLLGRQSDRVISETGRRGFRVAMAGFPMPAILQAQDINIISTKIMPMLAICSWNFSKQANVVVVNNMDHEAPDRDPQYLVAGAPDICFWFSGNRMRAFVSRPFEHFQICSRRRNKDVLGAAAGAVTVDGKRGRSRPAPPGMFYRKDVFTQLGATPPQLG